MFDTIELIIIFIANYAKEDINAKPCCRAATAECLACAARIDVEEYCRLNPTTVGCEGEILY